LKKHAPGKAYAISSLIGLLIAALILITRDILNLESTEEIWKAFSDAFFVPGIMYTCLGLLVLVFGTGQFDMLSYGMHSLLLLFTPFKKAENHEKFYEYQQARKAKRALKVRNYLMHVGLVFVAVACICTAMYYSAS